MVIKIMSKVEKLIHLPVHFSVIIRRLFIPLVLASVCFLPAAGCSHKPAGPLYKVSDRSYTFAPEAVFESIDSTVFFIGEHHNNPHHHENQLAVIREIHEKAEKPMAIGLEMFETGYQKQLDQWVTGSMDLDDFVRIYFENWDQPWFLYREIFLYAREHKIPLIALNIPQRVVRKVAQRGFKSLTMEDLAELPSGVTCDITPKYENFIQKVYGWHGRRNNSFANFCEAQVLWDTVMAVNILKFNARNPGTKLVVLAGEGHSWKPGIPYQVKSRKDLPITVFLPETAQLNRKNVTSDEADYLWLLKFIKS